MAFLRILNNIPDKVYIALSGGVDSMVCLDFLLKGGRSVVALHFNHMTNKSAKYEEFVKKYCNKNNVELIVGSLDEENVKGRSMEDFWREKRYSFFDSVLSYNDSLITCHHLDDAVETWIFSSLKGTPKIIPYRRGNVIRPLLLNKKSSLYNWAEEKEVPYIEDKTNLDNKFDRNYIRNIMMPHALHINPGLYKNIKKKIISKNS